MTLEQEAVETPEAELNEEIGEEYVEPTTEEAPPTETDNADAEAAAVGEQAIEETQNKGRTNDERISIAEEFYGVKKEDVVINKSGDLRIITKINGKKRLIDPQKDLIKGFGLNQAGYEKLNEGKQLVNQVKGFFDAAKSDPSKIWEMADKLGIDKYELAQKLLQQKVDEHDLSPEEKRMRDLEEREAQIKKREEEEEGKTKNAQHEAAKQEEMKKYDEGLADAMTEFGFQKSSNGTKSHILMGAIGELMVANQAGRDMSCRDAVYRTMHKWQDYVHGVFDDIDDDHIINVVPERIVKAIRKADLRKLGTGTPTSNMQIENESADDEVDISELERPSKKRKKQSMSDYFHNLK